MCAQKLAVAAVVLVVACSGGGDKPAGSGARTVTLTAPGAEPRRVVRYARGTIQRTLSFDFASTNPPVTAKLGVTWSCAPATRCRYQMTAFTPPGTAVDTDPLVAETRGEIGVAPDGAVEVLPATPKQITLLTDTLRLVIVSLPGEPIGLGATWTVIDGKLRRSYRLDELTDAGMRVHVDYQYTATSGQAGTGTGELEVGFDDPLPRGFGLAETEIAKGGSAAATMQTEIRLR